MARSIEQRAKCLKDIHRNEVRFISHDGINDVLHQGTRALFCYRIERRKSFEDQIFKLMIIDLEVGPIKAETEVAKIQRIGVHRCGRAEDGCLQAIYNRLQLARSKREKVRIAVAFGQTNLLGVRPSFAYDKSGD